MSQSLPRPRSPGAIARLLLLLVLALVSTAPSVAQIDTLRPLKRMFGVADDEFFKGGWMKIRPDTVMADDSTTWVNARQLWRVADDLGVNVLRIQALDLTPRMVDSLISQRWRPDQRVIAASYGDEFYRASIGRDAKFYTFIGQRGSGAPVMSNASH